MQGRAFLLAFHPLTFRPQLSIHWLAVIVTLGFNRRWSRGVMRLALAIGCALAGCASLAPAQAPPNVPLNQRVLVVYNSSVKGSKQVAEYYMRKRGIPAANLCRIWTAREGEESNIAWDDYADIMRNPVRKCLNRVGRDKVLYIVFSYGSPYHLSGLAKHHGTAVDGYVADIWEEGKLGPARNPYYVDIQSRAGIYPAFTSLADYRAQASARTIYSVWRLDAGSPALAQGLVDKALEAESTGLSGRVCIDRRYGADIDSMPDSGAEAGDWDLHRAAQFFRDLGLVVIEDPNDAEFGTPPAPARCDDAVFYAGWYALDHYNDVFSWKPGALGFHLDSASLTNPRGGSNWGANAVMRGLTITSGSVDEPYLDYLPHVDGIVHDLLTGANAGDALLRNTMLLRWMVINVGDPLYRPKFNPPRK